MRRNLTMRRRGGYPSCMDTFTHGVLGAVTAQLGFRQRIGREAAWVAAAVALLPDLDMTAVSVKSLFGLPRMSLDMMVIHRGLSHSLFLMPLLALPLAFLWRVVRRRFAKGAQPSFRLLYFCVLTALCSQPLLDIFTSYGTQIFSPFTHKRFAIDALPIVDIIYTPILLLTLLACLIARLTKRRGTLKVAWLGFLISVAYIAAGFGIHEMVLHQAKIQIGDCGEDRAAPAEFRAYPQIGTIFVWRVTRQCPHSWFAARVNVLFGIDFRNAAQSETEIIDNEWVRKARQLPEIKTFDWFALGQLRAAYIEDSGKHMVDFYDMRYAMRPEGLTSIWSIRAVFDESGKLVEVGLAQQYGRGSRWQTLGEMWRYITHPSLKNEETEK